MKHSIKRDEKTGDIHITVNVSNNLSNTSNSSADNTNSNTNDNDLDTHPESKPFVTQMLEGVAILGATAIASMFF